MNDIKRALEAAWIAALTVIVMGFLLVGWWGDFKEYVFAPSCVVEFQDRTLPNKTINVRIDSGQQPGLDCAVWESGHRDRWAGIAVSTEEEPNLD